MAGTEKSVLEELTIFNKKTGDIKYDIEVLYRVVCSVLQKIHDFKLLNLELIKQVPEGTIFTRTCRKGHDQRDCGKDLDSHTTFTNISTLGNLMIANAKTVNDSVVFLKTSHNLQFLDLNIIAQIFGAQIKSGVAATDKVGSDGDSRGIFSACCQIQHMPDFCRKLGVHGVIQLDSADTYYFNEDTDSTLPNFKKDTPARRMANELVLETIKNKYAYPVFETKWIGVGDDARLQKSGALFPEFNFHVDNLNQHLEYCTTDDEIFKSEQLNKLISADPELLSLNNKEGHVIQVPMWNLDKILSNPEYYTSYLNFQKGYFRLQQLDDVSEWIQNSKWPNIYEIPEVLFNRQALIRSIFRSNFSGLPYLSGDPANFVDKFESVVVQMIKGHDHIPVCGTTDERFPSASSGPYNPIGTQVIYKTDGGKKMRKRKKTHVNKIKYSKKKINP